ncbi:MAG: hypothetical protein ACFCUN_06485 [Hyphomicrobiaceae bacterium]
MLEPFAVPPLAIGKSVAQAVAFLRARGCEAGAVLALAAFGAFAGFAAAFGADFVAAGLAGVLAGVLATVAFGAAAFFAFGAAGVLVTTDFALAFGSAFFATAAFEAGAFCAAALAGFSLFFAAAFGALSVLAAGFFSAFAAAVFLVATDFISVAIAISDVTAFGLRTRGFFAGSRMASARALSVAFAISLSQGFARIIRAKKQCAIPFDLLTGKACSFRKICVRTISCCTKSSIGPANRLILLMFWLRRCVGNHRSAIGTWFLMVAQNLKWRRGSHPCSGDQLEQHPILWNRQKRLRGVASCSRSAHPGRGSWWQNGPEPSVRYKSSTRPIESEIQCSRV